MVEEVRNLATDKLPEKINNSISILGIDGCEDNVLSISNQGKYFDFLRVVSGREPSTRPWESLLQGVVMFLVNSKQNIQDDIKDTAEKINNTINFNINSIAEGIEEDYRRKMKLLGVQQLSVELNKGRSVMLNMTEAIADLSTAQALSIKIRDTISNLDIDTLKIRSSAFNISHF